MTELPRCLPFCGWLFNSEKVKFEEVLAPPYDIVSEEELNIYKQKSPYNIFHLELPESFEVAKLKLREFMDKEILIRNGMPSLYYYEIKFPFEGATFIRRGYILLVKLSSFSEGSILPHEKVYPKITEERFELFKATHCQFSQIFALYEDPELETFKDLPENLNYYFEVKFNKEIHRLAKIQDPSLIYKILKYLEDKKFFIADGHHRYTSALRFKEYMEREYQKTLSKKYNYISLYICPFEEKGLLMLPTHRVFSSKYYQTFSQKIDRYCHLIKEFPLKDWKEKEKFLKIEVPYFILYKGGYFKVFLFKESFLNSIEDKDFRDLPLYGFLKVWKDIFNISERELKERDEVAFVGSEEEAITKTQKDGFSILFPRSPVSFLKKIALKGKVFPHKATFFYPKILSGVVLYKFDED